MSGEKVSSASEPTLDLSTMDYLCAGKICGGQKHLLSVTSQVTVVGGLP